MGHLKDSKNKAHSKLFKKKVKAGSKQKSTNTVGLT